MHILHIYKDYFPVLGGIENHVRAAAEGVAARGHQVTVLVTNTAPRTIIERQANLTIIKAARQAHAASTPLSLPMFEHARRLTDVDVVHLHYPYPPADLLARVVPNHPPLVITYHSDIVKQQTILRLYGPLLRATLARADRILPTSPAYITSSAWLRPHADRCTVVPLSIDPQRFLHPDPAQVATIRACYDNAPLLLFVGRLRYYKGLHFLLEAMLTIRPAAHLLIIGIGPEDAVLRAQVQASRLEERVHFLGEIGDDDLPAYYAAAHVFVLPSHLRAEAFGIVQVEAQVAGLPVVCTELQTGTSFVTQHSTTGIVVPPADPPALARAVNTLLDNPTLARHLGQAGRARALQMFTHRHLIERLEAVYQQVDSRRKL
ncbi:MAG: glycosyltransferase [Chloroflexaceae bacterium]|nr:glycosyltransferase [Chloroflexaceae bacterium]